MKTLTLRSAHHLEDARSQASARECTALEALPTPVRNFPICWQIKREGDAPAEPLSNRISTIDSRFTSRFTAIAKSTNVPLGSSLDLRLFLPQSRLQRCLMQWATPPASTRIERRDGRQNLQFMGFPGKSLGTRWWRLARSVKTLFLIVVYAIVLSVPMIAADRPNILFIAIDDQNNWIGHMGGHPMAKTPHMDKLAQRGTSFLNAHCNAPLCNPSRTSLMLGLRPTTTGIYGLSPWFRTLPEWKDRVALPQHLANHGYLTAATGKIYHGGTGGGGGAGRAKGKKNDSNDEARPTPEFHITAPHGGVGSKPPEKLIPATPMGNHALMDWGVWPPDNDDTQKGDYQVATWTVEQIKSAPKDKPFFIAAGFFLPHVPCYATQKWFDLYPDDDSVLPKILENDRDDTPRFSWYIHWELPEPRLKWVKENNQWRNLVRSYLACTSFVDSQIGRLLTALEESGQADNTIVVVWGDHGWHLGEKAITGKNTLWDNGTRVPLIFAGPGVKHGQLCKQPAELLDIYPTLVDLTGVTKRDDLEGISLVPQLQDATAKRDRPAITSHNQGNHGIRSERWRYIHYADGSEELYDMMADPNEWNNIASKPEMASVIAEHKKWLPKIDLPPAPNSASRVLTYDKTTDEAIWEGKTVRRSDPIPE